MILHVKQRGTWMVICGGAGVMVLQTTPASMLPDHRRLRAHHRETIPQYNVQHLHSLIGDGGMGRRLLILGYYCLRQIFWKWVRSKAQDGAEGTTRGISAADTQCREREARKLRIAGTCLQKVSPSDRGPLLFRGPVVFLRREPLREEPLKLDLDHDEGVLRRAAS